MLDQTNANIKRHVKTHTECSDDDRAAVPVFETFLRSNGRINTSFASDDKWPNHDNTFEFVPNPDISRRPKQTFYVQIKGTRNYTKREGVIKYTLKDLAFPAFICDRVSLDPGILFVILNPAERGNERVFWKYMSPNFLNSIDFAKGSMTVSFSPEEEILNDDESVLAFCKRLEEIVERHSFVNQLERHSYSFEEAKRIVEACDEEITESIDNLSILNKNRDNISRRILTRLNDLCISALLLNAMKDGYQSPNAGFAWEYSLLRANTKYLGNFYRGLQYIGRRIPEEGQAERLMLKYYSFMWQIRQSLYENYGITVLQNLEKFQEYTGTDEQDKQYYELVANAFSTPKTEQKHNSNTRFYIQKRTPFYVGKERYFEVTLQQADIYASKYNRITAYTKLDISTGYSVQIDYVPSYINLWGVNTEIKIITAWRVSVDPKCLNTLGKILNMRLQLSSKYGEYDALMRFLTETGMDFLEMIDLREIPFSNLLESVYKKANTSYFKDVLQQLRDNYSTGSTRFGRYTIRYLLLNLREDLLERVMPSQFSPQWKCKDLYLSRKCFPFECNPLASDLADSKTSQISQAKYLARIVEKEKTEVAVPYWSIVKSMQDTGEIYCDLGGDLTEQAIQKYNDCLDDWEQLQPLILEKKRKLQFSNAETEVRCDGFVPDIYIPIRDSVLLVEIAVTHYVDIEKYNRIKRAKVPTIEIDISDFLKNTESFSEDELRKELIDSVEHKWWIYHRREQEGIQKLCERNRKREIEYQAQCKREREREEQREKWIEEQKLHEQKTLELFDELEKDMAYYLSFSRKLINSEQALNEIFRFISTFRFLAKLRSTAIEESGRPFYLKILFIVEKKIQCFSRRKCIFILEMCKRTG